MAIIRDICKSIGITLNMKSPENDVQKEYVLENDSEKMKIQIS